MRVLNEPSCINVLPIINAAELIAYYAVYKVHFFKDYHQENFLLPVSYETCVLSQIRGAFVKASTITVLGIRLIVFKFVKSDLVEKFAALAQRGKIRTPWQQLAVALIVEIIQGWLVKSKKMTKIIGFLMYLVIKNIYFFIRKVAFKIRSLS